MRVMISFLILLTPLSAHSRPVVAVLPFEEANTDWLSQGMAWSLSDKIRRVSALQMVDSDRLNAALSEHQTPVQTSVEAVQIGRSAGATLVLYGACQIQKNQLQISAHILRVETEEILELEEVSGPLESLFALQDSLIRRFLNRVDLRPTAIEWKAILRKPTRSVRAYIHWVRARSVLTGNAEDPDVVRDHLALALAEDADYADAHSHLGLFYIGQRRFREALGSLQTAVRLKPDDPLTRYNLGVTYASLGQPDRAAGAFQDAIRLKPDDPITHYNLGILHHLQGNHEAAISPLQTAVRLKPDFAVAYLTLGIALANTQSHTRAEPALKEAIRLSPENADAHYNLGVVYMEMRHHDQAVEVLERAISHNSEHADAHFNLGRAYEALGRYDEAVVAFKQAAQFNPDYADLHFNLGIAHTEAGRFEEAIRTLHTARRIYPQDPLIYHNMGIAYRNAARFEEAENAFREALRLNPHLADIHLSLGSLQLDMGRYEQGLSAIREAVRLTPKNADAHRYLGEALAYLKQYPDAIQAFRKAIELKRDNGEAHLGLGMVYLQAGQKTAAASALKRGLALDPDHPDSLAIAREIARLQNQPEQVSTYLNRARAFENAGLLDEAIDTYRKAASRSPENADIQHALGLACLRANRPEDALLALQKVLRLRPDHPDAGLIRDFIRRMEEEQGP